MLEELHYSLEAMQQLYFQIWLGTWPSCIDWTAAVSGTHVSAALYSLTRSLDYDLPPPAANPHNFPYDPPGSGGMLAEGQRIENEINKYFSQIIAYYFGEDAFALRMQAFDDMLWVVLGWISNVRFIQLHSDAHYPAGGAHRWYGQQFIDAFSHRARVFYDLAKEGWDERECGGGMNWNPRLETYKNAITNELFIAASVGMYLYFPGDSNTSPFDLHDQRARDGNESKDDKQDLPVVKPHDKRYLEAAVDGYQWLKDSNMTNSQGLYVDGFHVTRRPGRSPQCDVRNEMVYTYNQGVILSGLRSLWESTDDTQYLEDGHELVRNVIKATGFEKEDTSWHGLGRGGVLEELCDSRGTCSQDGQGFKGIFFHHLTLFCEPLPLVPMVPGVSYSASPDLAAVHRNSCKEYTRWVGGNAAAAMRTRDARGRFGGFWGNQDTKDEGVYPVGAEDYRNRGLGDEKKWGRGWEPVLTPPRMPSFNPEQPFDMQRMSSGQNVITNDGNDDENDPNEKGRGRTVETQGAGMAVVRSMWEFIFYESGSYGLSV
jgi:hypothetical protein